jgi:hypothetical protein
VPGKGHAVSSSASLSLVYGLEAYPRSRSRQALRESVGYEHVSLVVGINSHVTVSIDFGEDRLGFGGLGNEQSLCLQEGKPSRAIQVARECF